MKKWKVFVLLASMIAVLSACSSGSSNGNSSRSTSGSSDGGSSGKLVTVTQMDYFSDERRSKIFEDLIKEFEASHPNIKIERTPVPYEQLLPKSLRQAKTDSLPTILVTDNLNIPTMIAAGALEPIEKFGEIDESKYLEGPLATVTYNDKLYGLPLGSNDLALFYNKAMFEEAGLEPPETWDELVSAAQKLHQGSTYGIAFSAPNNQQATWQFSPFIWGNGGDFTNMASSESVGALKLWKTLVETGGASPSVVNFSQGQVYNEFASKRAAMMVMGPWQLPPLAETDIEYGIVPLPQPEKGQKAISPIGGEDFAITTSASPEQQKAAFTFIKWMQDKERLAKFDKKFGYMPAYKPAYKEFVANNPKFKVFAEELKNARALTAKTGVNFAEVSKVVSSTIQKVLTSVSSAEKAAKEAQSEINQIMGK